VSAWAHAWWVLASKRSRFWLSAFLFAGVVCYVGSVEPILLAVFPLLFCLIVLAGYCDALRIRYLRRRAARRVAFAPLEAVSVDR
jgi:hypothetical protein